MFRKAKRSTKKPNTFLLRRKKIETETQIKTPHTHLQKKQGEDGEEQGQVLLHPCPSHSHICLICSVCVCVYDCVLIFFPFFALLLLPLWHYALTAVWCAVFHCCYRFFFVPASVSVRPEVVSQKLKISSRPYRNDSRFGTLLSTPTQHLYLYRHGTTQYALGRDTTLPLRPSSLPRGQWSKGVNYISRRTPPIPTLVTRIGPADRQSVNV